MSHLIPLKPVKMPENIEPVMRKYFNELDKDGDGGLNTEEISVMLQKYDIHPSFKFLAKELCDKNGDGLITFDFYRLLGKLDKNPTCLYEAAFKIYDKDKDGYINKEELEGFLRFFLMEEPDSHTVRLLLSSFDKDQDEKLDFNELCKLMNHFGGNLHFS